MKDFIKSVSLYSTQFCLLNKVVHLSEVKKTDDVYFLTGINPEVKTRAKDVDILGKKHLFFDIDIRKDKEYEMTDEEIKQAGIFIGEMLKEDEEFKNWSYIIFTGNGLHIYYIGDEIKITEHYGEAYEMLCRRFEQVTGERPDTACKNPARIARLPGTYNNKAEPKKVEIIAKQEARSELIKFLETYKPETKKIDKKKQNWDKEITVEEVKDYAKTEPIKRRLTLLSKSSD
jgi:hypothetical protein